MMRYDTSKSPGTSSSQKQEIADRVAQCALNHYDTFSPNGGGKPQPGKEWTVYAAIIASRKRLLSVDELDVRSKHDKTNHEKRSEVSDKQSNLNHNEDDDMWVVSCATGSKCCAEVNGPQKSNQTAKLNWGGGVLHDSHAEVLARRGLMRVLWLELESYLDKEQERRENPDHPIIQENRNSARHFLLEKCSHSTTISLSEETTEKKIEFGLRHDISLHLYVSDPPCGDCSIYELDSTFIHKSQSTEKHCKITVANMPDLASNLNFTGAKLVCLNNDEREMTIQSKHKDVTEIYECNTNGGENESNGREPIKVARELNQKTSALRTKSSRSNIPQHLRTQSMSCSDKICRWQVLGIQGDLLSYWVPKPIVFSSIVVSRDLRQLPQQFGQTEAELPQLKALKRGICSRVESVFEELVSICDRNETEKNNNIQLDDPCCKNKDNCCQDIKCFLSSDTAFQVPKAYIVDKYFLQGMNYTNYVVHQKSLNNLEHNNNTGPTMVNGAKQEKPSEEKKQKIKHAASSQSSSSPCGISLNWQVIGNNEKCDPSFKKKKKNGHESKQQRVEQTVGASGIKPGPKKIKSQSELTNKRFSRLSRFVFVQHARRCHELFMPSFLHFMSSDPNNLNRRKYQYLKLRHRSRSLSSVKNVIFSGMICDKNGEADNTRVQDTNEREKETCGPLVGWIRSHELGDFVL